MRTPSNFALALATLAAAAPSPQAGTPDGAIDFVISIFENNLTCAAPGRAVFGVGCQNRTLPKGGSAFVRISTISPNGLVTGWSEPDCRGTALVVFDKLDGCTSFDDVEVKSWIGKAPYDENGK
jgi:hypothetical protein